MICRLTLALGASILSVSPEDALIEEIVASVSTLYASVGWLALPSGLLMFAAHADDLLGNRAFQLKMGLLLAAGMNAAIFHTGPYQGAARWDAHAAAPAVARLSAAASIAIWIAVIACGRLLAQR